MNVITRPGRCPGRQNREDIPSGTFDSVSSMHALYYSKVRGGALLGHGGDSSSGSRTGGFDRGEQKAYR